MTRDERFEACFLKYKNLVMRFVIDATGDYQAAQEKSIAICEEKMNHRELLGKILAEVRKVNEQWYEILMLLCVEQCTYEETAQRLGISVMVLRARLYRARSYVRKHYGAEYRES